MSNKKVAAAILEGFDGPFFPVQLNRLHRLLYQQDVNFGGRVLRAMVHQLGFTGEVKRLQTTDGYDWFWCIEVSGGGHKIVIALPWSQDSEQQDGTSSDRHSALYCTSKKAADQATTILQNIAFWFTRPTSPKWH